MELPAFARWRGPRRGPSRTLYYDVVEAGLIIALAWAAVMLVWMLVRPLGPVGRWQALGSARAPADPAILTRLDPFFRVGSGGTATVTSLPLKLFGVRLDQAMGRGSAIIATPDGVQSSYGVGDEIVPGVKLKAVAIDGITISRGGVDEQLFLDQSTAATPTAGSPAPVAPAALTPPTTAPTLTSAVAFAPRMTDGRPNGVVLTPKGDAAAFAALGLQPGDVVTQINARGTRSVDEAVAALGAIMPGQPVTLTVERGGQMTTVTPGATR